MSLGCWSPLLSRNLGVYLPIYPVKGYSLTYSVKQGDEIPEVGGVDEDNLLAFSRLGEGMSTTSYAGFTGYKTQHQLKDFHGMVKAAKNLFPDACDYSIIFILGRFTSYDSRGFPYFWHS